MQVEYLSWNHPLLRTAARYLVDRFTQDGRLDLRNMFLVLPGSRAVLRLEEILLETVENEIIAGRLDPAWFPPRFLTVGRFPEMLYDLKRPLADELVQQFTWIAALDQFQREKPDVLARLLPHPPDENDLASRLSLAKIFAALHRELAAETLDFNGVAQKCRLFGITSEAIRWDTLAELQQRYHTILDGLGFWDVQTARIFAINNKEPKTDHTIVLVGTVDLNLAQKRILDLVSGHVISLVFAPESLRERFDHYGCVVSKKWKDAPIELTDSQIEVVGTPVDQATALALWLANRLDGRLTSEDVSLGVPNEELVPLVEQQVRQAGGATRYVAGIPLGQTAPHQFLESVAKLVESKRFSDFADLLRHPYFPCDPGPQVDLLSESDRYHSHFLPTVIEEDWRQYTDPNGVVPTESFDALKQAWSAIETLIHPLFSQEPQSPQSWSEAMGGILQSVFSQTAIQRNDHNTLAAIKEINNRLAQLADLPEQLVSSLFASEFLMLLLRQLQTIRIAPPADKDAIEILGWLELAMDDAPLLVATGINDGIVPSSLSADLFLPDRIRQELEIEDNDRRFARDAYALSVILATKNKPDDILLITGRRSGEGDPLLPSRLFFATDPDTIARRVRRFFSVEEKLNPVVFPGTLQTQHQRSTFRIPEPKPLSRPVQSMRITEFRDYLACPYRYYLRHRLGLDVLHDHNEELDAAQFGNLAHEVLRRFGTSPYRNSTVAVQIAEYMDNELDKAAAELYGTHPRALVAIQMEQLRIRLRKFADWQADWVSQGNQIRFVELSIHEQKPEHGVKLWSSLLIDDERMMNLRGRIDRIDWNPKTGKWYIFDYKSSDSAKKPEAVHFKNGKWIDLQLPLYRHVIQKSFPEVSSIDVGYLIFPKDVSKAGALLADWDENAYENAIDTAKNVVCNIWEEQFGSKYMSVIPPAFSEIYSAICMDTP